MSDGVASVAGRLLRSPYRRISAARTTMLPFASDEFATVDALTPRNPAPILLTSDDLFDLLDRMVAAVRAALPSLERTFVQLAMPSTMRLPPGLLEPDVLLLPTVGGVFAAACGARRRVACIQQDLRRFPSEDFGNGVTVRWSRGARGEADAVAAALEDLGFAMTEAGADVRN